MALSYNRSTSPTSDDFVMVDSPLRSDKDTDGAHLINAKLLIPGRGEPIHNGCVVIKKGKIVSVSTQSDISPDFKGLPSTDVPVLMPGLWDCHLHLVGMNSLDVSQTMIGHAALAGARIARSLHDILMSGYTSMREPGGYGCEIAPAVIEGTIVGPNIYSAAAVLSQTAGHGDQFKFPAGMVWQKTTVKSYGGEPGAGYSPFAIADGIDEVRKAVRLQIRRGAKLIKVCASGGVLSRDDDPEDQEFSDEELKVIVEEAARSKRIVAAHVHGKAGILAALRAGCKTIEHGTYMDDECLALAKEKGVIYVPTRTISALGVDHPELMSPESYKKMLQVSKHHEHAMKLAIKSGITMATGSDIGMSAPVGHPLVHGNSGGEPMYLVKAGMTPLQAIEAATANGPLTLGPQAPLSGMIKEKYDADLIALNHSPLDDISLLKEPKNITHVWKGGKLFKSK